MLEGGEGCGKDTHADLLEQYLTKKRYEIINTKEPGGTPEAEKIRDILLDEKNQLDDITELYLYQAARKELSHKVIEPSLKQGKIIISKRGFPSSWAYQGYGGGLDIEFIERLNNRSIRNFFPDLIFILDIDPRIGLKKEVNPDRFAKKGLEYHQKVRQGYLDIAKRYPNITKIIPYKQGEEGKIRTQEEIRKKRYTG